MTTPVEIHTGCGGAVSLQHDVWRCKKCGAAPIPVDQAMTTPLYVVDNTGTASAPSISSMFWAEITDHIRAHGTLPAELDDVCTLRRVEVDGQTRWILDPA